MNLKTTTENKTENKASTFGVSEEKTVNKRFFERSPTNASERCRVAQVPVHDTVVDRYGGPLAVEGVAVEGVPSLASTCGGSYFPIYHFMTKELGLGGAKLLVYALIYSFTVSEGSFFGSRGYMEEACGASVKTVDRTLRELVKCGLLIKGEATHLESIEYKANISPQTEGESQNDAPSKMSHSESQNVSTPASKCLSGGVKMTHNNKDYNKTNIHTSIHAISAYANAKEDTEEVDRFAEEGNTGAKASLEKDRVIGEKNSFQRLLLGGSWRVATEGVASSFKLC